MIYTERLLFQQLLPIFYLGYCHPCSQIAYKHAIPNIQTGFSHGNWKHSADRRGSLGLASYRANN